MEVFEGEDEVILYLCYGVVFIDCSTSRGIALKVFGELFSLSCYIRAIVAFSGVFTFLSYINVQ